MEDRYEVKCPFWCEVAPRWGVQITNGACAWCIWRSGIEDWVVGMYMAGWKRRLIFALPGVARADVGWASWLMASISQKIFHCDEWINWRRDFRGICSMCGRIH